MVYWITLAFIIMDVLTGVVKAIKEKNFCSSVMREGLFHKVGSIMCIVFATMVDYASLFVGLTIVTDQTIANVVCGYIIMMEVGSIIENVCAINPEIAPDWLKGFFKKLNGNT